jgi:hypothetical protein
LHIAILPGEELNGSALVENVPTLVPRKLNARHGNRHVIAPILFHRGLWLRVSGSGLGAVSSTFMVEGFRLRAWGRKLHARRGKSTCHFCFARKRWQESVDLRSKSIALLMNPFQCLASSSMSLYRRASKLCSFSTIKGLKSVKGGPFWWRRVPTSLARQSNNSLAALS